MFNRLKRFIREEQAATMVEYGLMVALVAMICILVIAALGTNLGEKFDELNTGVVEAGSVQVQPANP